MPQTPGIVVWVYRLLRLLVVEDQVLGTLKNNKDVRVRM
jgi:hypothetical protein